MMQKHIKGFTIIEIMVVVAVIGILAAIAVPQYQNYIKKSQFAEVINMTSAIKISDALCMKEYNVKIGCSGGTNNVIQDITPLNKSKYTLSVVTLDGVITATARGPNDSAAIAAAGGFVPMAAPVPTGLFVREFVPKLITTTYRINGMPDFTTLAAAQNYLFTAFAPPSYTPGQLVYINNGSVWNDYWKQYVTRTSDGSLLFTPIYSIGTYAGCPIPTSGPAFTWNDVYQKCIRDVPTYYPAVPSTTAPPATTSLNNETYILNPTIDATGKITYTVGGTCIAAGLCQAN